MKTPNPASQDYAELSSRGIPALRRSFLLDRPLIWRGGRAFRTRPRMRRLYSFLLLLPLSCGCQVTARCALFVLECTDSRSFQDKLQEEELERQAEVRQVQGQIEEEAMRD